MEPFALAPSHIVMHNQGQSAFGPRTNGELRELRPMPKRDYTEENIEEEEEVYDRFGADSTTSIAPNDHSLSGLTWNEHDLVSVTSCHIYLSFSLSFL